MTEREERAKVWLNRNYGQALEIQAIQRRLERLNADLEKCVKPIRLREVMEGHGDGNGQEERMAEYIDLSEELSRRLMYLMSLDRKTLDVIEKVDSSILRTILIERYVNRLKWKDLAIAIHIEERRMFEYHLRALDAVLPYIPEEGK